MNYNWVPAHFLDEHSAFVTKTFLIRFCEEEVAINDVCVFRTEFDAYPMIYEESLFFECELLFSDILSMKQVNFFMEIIKNSKIIPKVMMIQNR